MNTLTGFAQDLRYAMRSLRRTPLLATICILTLALGVALNATVFAIISGLLFRPRVEKDPDRFVHLSPVYREPGTFAGRGWTISTEDYRVYARRSRSLQQLAAWDNVRVALGETESVLGLLVTCNFFSVYGLEAPAMGRLFAAEECAVPGSAPVVILSEEIWRQRFAADPQIIGKTVRLNRLPVSVVGIIPAGFSGRIRGPGIWMPWTMQPLFYEGHDFFREPARWLTAEGRLRPGFSRDEATVDLQVLASQQDRLHPGRQTTLQLTNGSLVEEPSLRGQIFWIGPVIMGGMALVLLVACTNVTVLQLSRAAGRRREMAIRLSLGAGSSRLLRMLLAENLVLASAAGLAGLLIALQAPRVFATLFASPETPVYQTTPDLATYLYLSAIVLLAACIAGLSPAAESLHIDLATSMKTGESGARRSRRAWHRGALIVSQVSMTFVLVSAAGLFIRARDTALHTSPGFETDDVLLLPFSLSQQDARLVTDRIRAIPGVLGVAFGSPLNQSDTGGAATQIRLPSEEKQNARQAGVTSVSAEYFSLLRVPVVRGRVFTPADGRDGSAVCVISERLAGEFWRGGDPIGQTIVMADDTPLRVVGVVRNVSSERIGQVDGPHLYRYAPESAQGQPMLIRFDGDSMLVSQSVRQALAQVDPTAVVMPKTLRSILEDAAERSRKIIRLLSGLAALAMFLAAAGVYGVVDFTMRRRTKEIGIRMALGASRRAIMSSALTAAARPVLIGLATGAIAAMIAGEILGRVLSHTPIALQPGDLRVYGLTALVLGTTALVAMFRPVWRAALTNPMNALRDE